MKNIHEVIRAKEEEVMRVKTEVEALRLIAPLLDEEDASRSNGKARGPRPVSDKG